MKTRWSTWVVMAVLASQTACYTTKIVTDRAPETRSRTYTDRQWFTIGGLVPLSGEAGRECPNGLSWAESQLSGTDILINIGLTIGGALVGSAACANSSDEERASCVTAGATLTPFLLGSRTVEYACAAGPTSAGPAWAPTNPEGARAYPPPPPPGSPQPMSPPPPPPAAPPAPAPTP